MGIHKLGLLVIVVSSDYRAFFVKTSTPSVNMYVLSYIPKTNIVILFDKKID